MGVLDQIWQDVEKRLDADKWTDSNRDLFKDGFYYGFMEMHNLFFLNADPSEEGRERFIADVESVENDLQMFATKRSAGIRAIDEPKFN